jgi:probable HAF family extracellular repeat protein
MILDLGAVDGDDCSWAWSLNSSDQVVGISVPFCDLSQARAFLWEKGSMVDLNTLVPPDSALHLVYAMAINDAGVIAGMGVPSGVSPGDVDTLGHAYILIPQPELSSYGTVLALQNTIHPAPGTSPLDLRPSTAQMTKHLRQVMRRPERLD